LYPFGYKYMQSFLFTKGLIQNSKGKLMTSKMLWLCLLKCTTTTLLNTNKFCFE
jgi:hypothetical protein